MKSKTIYGLFLIIAVMMVSCELPDNIDPKNAQKVSADALFTQAQIGLTDQLGSMNVNLNISRLLAQYQSEVSYTTESRYLFHDRQIPDNFSDNIYRDALMNLKECRKLIANKGITPSYPLEMQTNQIAIAEIWAVYAWHVLVDQFGNIPYTEALMGAENSRPKYDDALTIYQDLIDRLDDAIADLDTDFDSFGNADLLYNGDVASWIKFAASLKLRIALRLADVPAANSGTLVTEALATGVFTKQAESAIWVPYGIAPYISPYYEAYVLDARKDFCPTNTLVDLMTSLNDPRRAVWFTQYPEGSGLYKGLLYGKEGSSSYKAFSHFTDEILFSPDFPTILLDYVEVEFLLAEAAERNLGGVTGPANHYRTAIEESMKYWGVSSTDANAYLAQATVSYGTATGDYKQKIGTQKWLALFDRGVEGWAEWRRLDYPILNPPEGMTYADIPVRMPYPFNEDTQNKDNWLQASQAIGGDEASTKLFWDVYDPELP